MPSRSTCRAPSLSIERLQLRPITLREQVGESRMSSGRLHRALHIVQPRLQQSGGLLGHGPTDAARFAETRPDISGGQHAERQQRDHQPGADRIPSTPQTGAADEADAAAPPCGDASASDPDPSPVLPRIGSGAPDPSPGTSSRSRSASCPPWRLTRRGCSGARAASRTCSSVVSAESARNGGSTRQQRVEDRAQAVDVAQRRRPFRRAPARATCSSRSRRSRRTPSSRGPARARPRRRDSSVPISVARPKSLT